MEWIAVTVFALAYLAIATEKINRAAAALGVAALVLAFSVVGARRTASSRTRPASTGRSSSCCSG